MEKTSSTSISTDLNSKLSLISSRKFAHFLIGKVDQVSEEYFKLYSEEKSSLFQLFDKNAQVEIKELVKKDLTDFLEGLSKGTVVQNKLLELGIDNLSQDSQDHPFKDFYRFHLIIKVFAKFLPLYTTQMTEGMKIIQELQDILWTFALKVANQQSPLHPSPIEDNFIRSLLTYSANGILVFDRDMLITVWNEKMESFTEIKKKFVFGKKIFDLFPDYQNERISKVLEGEKIFISERAFSEDTRYYKANALPIYNSENEVTGGLILFDDTTHKKLVAKHIEENKVHLQHLNNELLLQIQELKKTQDQLKNNAKLLWKTQQLAHMGTWVWNVKENKIKWSEELSEIFGVQEPIESGTIKSYMQRVHLEERGAFLRRIREAVRSQRPFDYQHRIVFPDGSIRHIYGEGIPELVNGQLIITGFSQDITMKMKALETLQASENRFRALCEKSPDGIFLVDLQRILYCNQAAVSMLGAQNKSQILKLNFQSFSWVSQNEHNDLKENLFKAFQGDTLRFESLLKKVDDSTFWGEIIFTPIKLEDKDILHVVIRDISLRKQVEQEIKIAHEQLEKINDELESRIEERTRELEDINKNLVRVNADLDNFIYSASHDLKAPILNIEGLINELIQHPSYLEKEVKLLVDMMMKCVKRFTRTIHDLTEVTKTVRSDFEDSGEINLEEEVNDIEMSIQNLILSSGATIIKNFSEHKTVNFSRRNFESVLLNLINNAIKYRAAERQPKIIIESKDSDGFITLSVKDNGLGLKEKDKEKIFQMFKRVHNHIEGSGIGLYLVKRIMENAGGKVEVESKLGEGSAFKLYFRKRNA